MSETPDEAPHEAFAEVPGERLRPSPPSLRAAGAIIDYMVVLMVVVPVLKLTARSGEVTSLGTTLSIVLIAGYPIIGIGWFSTTLGKWVTRQSVSRNGKRPPGLLAASLRYLVSAMPFFVSQAIDDGSGSSTFAAMASIILFGLVYLPILFDPERRGLHDRAAGTIVVTHLRTLADRVERSRPPV